VLLDHLKATQEGLTVAVLTIECEGCWRNAWSVHIPRDMAMTPDQSAREVVSEDTEVERERTDAESGGYTFADGRKETILRCRICGTPTRWMPK
jgi:hypothetical protein